MWFCGRSRIDGPTRRASTSRQPSTTTTTSSFFIAVSVPPGEGKRSDFLRPRDGTRRIQFRGLWLRRTRGTTSSASILLEIIASTVDDCLAAESGGADRIELCAAIGTGGLTPSLGTLIEAKKRVRIPLMAMVRPRSGGFCYSEANFAAMQRDAVASAGARRRRHRVRLPEFRRERRHQALREDSRAGRRPSRRCFIARSTWCPMRCARWTN